MSRLTTASVALLLGLFFESAIAQDGIPVEDRSNQNSSTGNSAASTPVVVAPVAPSSVPTAPAPRPTTTSSSNAALGELLMMLDQLQEEVGMLRGQVEQQQHQLKKMQVDQRDRYRDLDRRLSLLNQQAYSAPATALPLTPLARSASVGSSTSATSASTTTPLAVVPAVAASSPTVSDSQAFKDAFALVRKSRFDQALQAFEQFLITYPQSTLTANVLYWTGEVHRAQSNPDLEKASFAYQQVIERYPNNAKVADAYYKLGLCYQGLKQTEKAKATMNKLIELFPDQVTAELARDFLKQQR